MIYLLEIFSIVAHDKKGKNLLQSATKDTITDACINQNCHDTSFLELIFKDFSRVSNICL